MPAAKNLLFHLTVTVNFADGSEIADIEFAEKVSSDEIGEAAMTAAVEAQHSLQRAPVDITSLVIVAVVA